jgi:hypothetical protein
MNHPLVLTPQPSAPQLPILKREAPFPWERLPIERQHELITTLAAILIRQLSSRFRALQGKRMNANPKIQPQHLERQAYVYIRQSTMKQVEHNLESHDLQYQLVQRAQGLGWPRCR